MDKGQAERPPEVTQEAGTVLKPALAKALVAFQGKVPTIEKTQTAKVRMKAGGEYSYKYADLGDIWKAIREPLAEAKLAVTQTLSGGTGGKTLLTTTVWHEEGDTYSSSLVLDTGDRNPQEAASVFTYYKRYTLSAVLGIATEEDDDGKIGTETSTPKSSGAPSGTQEPSEKQIGLIKSLAKRKGKDEAWIAKVLMSVNSKADASGVIDKLNELEDAA